MISFILPTRNTLPYTKLAYSSLRRYNQDCEIILMDDLSTDGTREWMDTINDKNTIIWKNDPTNFPKTYDEQTFSGHTLLYNIGAQIANGPIIGIFHSDMICTKNYSKNLLKHLKPKTIVSATRIEPPVYPRDNIKFTENFGVYFDEFKQEEFDNFIKIKEKEFDGIFTHHFFAPWIMYQEEYLDLGGMNPIYAPYPCEDSDFVERLVNENYQIIQSWDSIVYHFCSRGHRWTTGKVGVDTDYFKKCQNRSLEKFIELWGKYPNPPNFEYNKN